MKSISRLFVFSLVMFTAFGCASRDQAKARQSDRETVSGELSKEMSLREDRESLDDLRKEIPEDTQKQNDELALYLNLMAQGNEKPQMARDKFNLMVQKKRAVFRDKVAKLRENFRDGETERREKQTEEAKAKRDSFMKKKNRDPKVTREFFQDLDKERLVFASDERARRTAFEGEINAQSKDFDSYMREKQKEFDEQYRLYTKKFSEKPKEKKAATGDEFRRLEQAPATSLGTED